ncbi:UNKNOWN [Stylonychia lemnae]|uniref:Transmembrane protein n=1 Tax=Stylonychia lemnae TaxID=5949 RepID=A0A078AUE7_STYLE|nr:UNKNOWN [Stylonychia lemnae]|eukprot:CDW84483.1 UNKNOWN [Stylonychia lemnae]
MDAEEARRRRREKLLQRAKQLDNPDQQEQSNLAKSEIIEDSYVEKQTNQNQVKLETSSQHQEAYMTEEMIEKGSPRLRKDQCCDHGHGHSHSHSHSDSQAQSRNDEDDEPVDFKKLYQLQEDNQRHIKIQQVIRFLFSALTGVWFHLFYNVFDLKVFNVSFFVAMDIGLITMLVYYQKNTYTFKINRMIKQTERKLQQKEQNQEKEEQPENGQIDKAFDVMDLILQKSDQLKTLQNIWSYLKIGKWIIDDTLLHIWGVIFIDSCLIIANQIF